MRVPQTATRLEDLQLVVSQTLERLMALRRYQIEPERSGMPMMYRDRTGDWLEFNDMLDAIEGLRRAMGDCILDEEG